jgi:hypothetical protein
MDWEGAVARVVAFTIGYAILGVGVTFSWWGLVIGGLLGLAFGIYLEKHHKS